MCFSQNSGCFGENICFSGKKGDMLRFVNSWRQMQHCAAVFLYFCRHYGNVRETARGPCRAVVHMPRVSSELRVLPFWPICKERCERHASAVGETVPGVGAGTRLRLRARCSGSNTGRRSPWGPATRKGCPGVESPTASWAIVALFDNHWEAQNAARFSRALSGWRLWRSIFWGGRLWQSMFWGGEAVKEHFGGRGGCERAWAGSRGGWWC